jgi:hypothetical protein
MIGRAIFIAVIFLQIVTDCARYDLQAQTRVLPKILNIPQPIDTPAQLWAKIKSASRADLLYAKALADSADTPGAKARANCYGAWVKVIDQQTGALPGADGKPIGEPPDPHIFTTFEQIAQTSDNLQPNSEFMIACAPVAQALRLRFVDFIGKVISGGIGLNLFVPGL